MKKLLIKKYGCVVGLQKYKNLKRLYTSKESRTPKDDPTKNLSNKKKPDDTHDIEKKL